MSACVRRQGGSHEGVRRSHCIHTKNTTNNVLIFIGAVNKEEKGAVDERERRKTPAAHSPCRVMEKHVRAEDSPLRVWPSPQILRREPDGVRAHVTGMCRGVGTTRSGKESCRAGLMEGGFRFNILKNFTLILVALYENTDWSCAGTSNTWATTGPLW